MRITTIDKKGLNFLKQEEGCILHPYLDKAGVATIGYGMTYYPISGKKVTMRDRAITQNEADFWLLEMLKPYEQAVLTATRDDITQNNFNGLTSLCYNIGKAGYKNSTVCRLVNLKVEDERLKTAFKMWRKAGGEYSPELEARRVREYNLYITK